MDDLRLFLIGVLITLISASVLRCSSKSNIPAVIGSEGLLSSYIAVYRYFRYGADIIQKGSEQYPNGVFRVPRFFVWQYVVDGKQRIGELAAAPENVLSFMHGVSEDLQMYYTMGPQFTTNPYHEHTVRTTLTRNLARCFPHVRDEIVCAFDDVLALQGSDWKSFQVLPDVMQIVARTSNRLFVGFPICREPDYLTLNIDYTIAVVIRGVLISLVPDILKPILAPLISTRKRSLKQVLKFLEPILEDRLAKENELGPDWPDKPNDLISWLLESAEGTERTAPSLAARLLVINMAAIHTSSMAFTHALLDLVTYPEHIAPMRAEAERVVQSDGWTKAALGNMHKMDSFLRESQRVNPMASVMMNRRCVAPEGFTFSDGVHIPCGAFVVASARAAQYDPENYENPETFDGFRFAKMREAEAGPFKRHMVTTAPDHLAFGHGRHACPGRFFAATELKAMLAHVLLNYDVRAETEGVRPPDDCIGQVRTPNREAKVWIRKRQ
ncbi:cytochrome P450 [Mycena epipterygia]|nr:cytochrome P450 [Mycena epipterygia]